MLPSLGTPRLLVVDDETTAREGLGEFLEEEGFEVRTAADGVAALDLIGGFAPAVLITDLDMPRLDGRDLCRTVRQRRLQVQILVLTAHDASDSRRAAAELGADDYVAKPIDLDDVLRRVQHLVRRSRPPISG